MSVFIKDNMGRTIFVGNEYEYFSLYAGSIVRPFRVTVELWKSGEEIRYFTLYFNDTFPTIEE